MKRLIVFDLDGTLAESKRPLSADTAATQACLLGVEMLSDHPLAKTSIKNGRSRPDERPLLTATDLKSLTGRGVTATVDGETVWIGKADRFGTEGVPELGPAASDAVARLRHAGRTTIVVQQGERDLGAFGLMNTPRAAARATPERLHGLGITRMIRISGDNQRVAEAIAKDVGLSRHPRSINRQNVFVSLGAVALLVPATILGLGIGPAVTMHGSATLLVVFTTLRLLAYADPVRQTACSACHPGEAGRADD